MSLQNNLHSRGKSIHYLNSSFKEKVDELTRQKRNLDTEFVELLERLPWKEWKTYSPEVLQGWVSEEQKLECQYEVIDMFHFFMNICLLMGIDGDTFEKLYMTKNKENFDRQERGY